MSMALIVQREANGVQGGSARGYISGTDSGAAVNTFYTRRLTDLLINEASTVVSFTASSGGAGAPSTGGTFTLSPGTYRFTIRLTFYNATAVFGLYNITNGAFQNHAGTSIPIVSGPVSTSNSNGIGVIEAVVTVSGANNVFDIRHESLSTPALQSLQFGGSQYNAAITNVNGAAVQEFYSLVKILKTA